MTLGQRTISLLFQEVYHATTLLIPPSMIGSRYKAQTHGYSSEHRRDIFIRGDEAPFMGDCWRTYVNVPEPTFLHRNLPILVRSKHL